MSRYGNTTNRTSYEWRRQVAPVPFQPRSQADLGLAGTPTFETGPVVVAVSISVRVWKQNTCTVTDNQCPNLETKHLHCYGQSVSQSGNKALRLLRSNSTGLVWMKVLS